MSTNFKAVVNQSAPIKLTSKDTKLLNALKISDTELHLISEHKSITATILNKDVDKKAYTIELQGQVYHVKLQDNVDQQIEQLGLQAHSQIVVNSIEAPMPGVVLSVLRSENEEVKEGDALLILEAMKMENVLLSPRNGTIKSINVQQGTTVEKGMLLLTFNDTK